RRHRCQAHIEARPGRALGNFYAWGAQSHWARCGRLRARGRGIRRRRNPADLHGSRRHQAGFRYSTHPRDRRCGTGAGHRLGWSGHVGAPRRGHPRRPCHRGPRSLHLPLQRAHHFRGQAVHGPRRTAYAARCLTGGSESGHPGLTSGWAGSRFATAKGGAMARGRKPMANFSLHDLEKRVQERAKANAQVSYTRRLLDQGVGHCAKKLGEEAIETVLAAVEEDRARLIAEAADLIYHLLVVLASRGITLAEVEATLAERTR